MINKIDKRWFKNNAQAQFGNSIRSNQNEYNSTSHQTKNLLSDYDTLFNSFCEKELARHSFVLKNPVTNSTAM